MKQAAFLLAALIWTASAGAQQVAEDVLKNSAIQGVEFRNYEGPHKVIESRLAIQGIGTALGRQMQAPGALNADFAGKYSVVRLHDPASDKLSADLLILSPEATVDHIRNLNWIVSAYLQTTFGYSTADGDLLAAFVTRYNAWYRGKMDYFAAAYIPEVGRTVTADQVGLSTLWSDWPGRTQMVIPLRDSLSKGLAGGVNTEEISNKDVVTQMAQEPGQGLDDRKKLADLKEAEIVKEQKAVAQAESTPASPGGAAAVTPPASNPKVPEQGAPSTPATTSTPAATTEPAAATTPAPAAAAASSPAAPAALPLAEAKKDLAARDQALQAERKDIVKQETQAPAPAKAAEAPKVPALTVPFVRMTEATKMGQLWLIDPATNTVWKKSALNSIRQTGASAFGAGLLVVAGDSKGNNAAVRLVVVSKDDGSVLTTGSDDVSPDSPMLVTGKQVYALTKGEKGGWVMGLFDTDLKLLTKGTDPLTSVTGLVPTATGLLVQSAGGGLLFLDDKTLQKKANVEG